MAQQTYTTKAGDTLGAIAAQYGVNLGDITGYRSGDPNKIGVGENLSIATRDIPKASTINADNLGADPYKVAPPTPKTGYAGLIETSNAVVADLKPKVKEGAEEITGVYDKLGEQNKKRVGLYDSEGVYDKEKAYKEATNLMTSKDLAYRRKIEKIREENPTGQLQAGQQIAIEQVERDWAREKADLAVIAAAARDDWTTAKGIIDDKVNAETEDLTTELAGLQFFYSQNFNSLTDAQKTLLLQQTSVVENDLADKRSRLAEVGSIQLAAAQNGAPASTIIAIGNASDTTSAIAAAGAYLDTRKGGASGVSFSDSQIADGAAAAGVGLSEFQGFDEDTKNFFINGDLSGSKKSIDEAYTNEGATFDQVKTEIEGMGLPAAGTEYLIQYAEESAKTNEYTPEKMQGDMEMDLKGQKEEGKNRADAYNAVKKLWSYDGDQYVGMTDDEVARLNAAIEAIYGKRSFLDKILPGGN